MQTPSSGIDDTNVLMEVMCGHRRVSQWLPLEDGIER